MKTALAILSMVLWAVTAQAQFLTPNGTTTCQSYGTMTGCSSSDGNLTTIQPIGPGMNYWSNGRGESGTITDLNAFTKPYEAGGAMGVYEQIQRQERMDKYSDRPMRPCTMWERC